MKRYVLAAAIASVLVGCQSTGNGQKEFDVSQQLASVGNYAEAVAYLQQALSKEPKNEKYSSLLANYKTKASAKRLSEVKKILATDPLTSDSLTAASAMVEEASTFTPNLAEIGSLKSEVEKQRGLLVEKVKQLYGQARDAIDARDWVKAQMLLAKIKPIYPSFEAAQPLINQVSSEGTRDYLIQARDAYKSYDFENAKLLARKALIIDRNNAIAKKIEADSNTNNNQAFFKNLAASSLDNKNWQQAIFACDKVLAFSSFDSDCQAWRTSAIEKQADELVEQGSRLLREGYIARAIQITKSIEEMMGRARTAKVQALKSAVIDRTDMLIQQHVEDGYYGVAWYFNELLEDLDPLIPSLFTTGRDIEDRIAERVIKSIAVFPFNSPSYSEDSGELISGKLRADLFDNASQDTKILERENLGSILEEMKLGQVGVISELEAKEMGRLYGIDIGIMGSVMLFKVDESKSESTETVRYEVDQEIKDNIEFLNWKALNPKPSKEDLAKAPQAKIMQPVYAEKEYTVRKAKKVGFIEISYRIVDISTGENIDVDTITERVIREDTGNDGVKDANIKYDPLDIATDTEMLQSMAETVVEKLSRKVLQPLRNRELSYFKEGEELYLKRKENLMAFEKFVDALFDERIKSNANSPISAKVNVYIKEIADAHKFVN